MCLIPVWDKQSCLLWNIYTVVYSDYGILVIFRAFIELLISRKKNLQHCEIEWHWRCNRSWHKFYANFDCRILHVIVTWVKHVGRNAVRLVPMHAEDKHNVLHMTPKIYIIYIGHFRDHVEHIVIVFCMHGNKSYSIPTYMFYPCHYNV